MLSFTPDHLPSEVVIADFRPLTPTVPFEWNSSKPLLTVYTIGKPSQDQKAFFRAHVLPKLSTSPSPPPSPTNAGTFD